MAKKAAEKAFTILGDNEIGKESTLLVKAIQGSDKRIQRYLVSEIVHIEEHRNPTRLNQFFSAVKGSGARTTAMHAFVQAFGNIELVKGKYVMRTKRDPKLAQSAKDKAIATMWTTLKPEPNPVQFDAVKRVTSLESSYIKYGIEKGWSDEEIKANFLKTVDEVWANARKQAEEALKAAASAKAEAAVVEEVK
jgi:hypothetical protein